MIYQCDMDKVIVALKERARYCREKMETSTDNEELYGFLHGIEDATEIAIAILRTQQEVSGDEEFDELCKRITDYTDFSHGLEDSVGAQDYLSGFWDGRIAGGLGAVNALKLVNAKDWMEEETEDA